MDGIFLHSSYSEGTTQLQEPLQVGARAFIRLVTEWASLYHRNEASFDIKVFVPGVDHGASGHLISRGSRVLMKSLLAVDHMS
jgi:hypothetical protein